MIHRGEGSRLDLEDGVRIFRRSDGTLSRSPYRRNASKADTGERIAPQADRLKEGTGGRLSIPSTTLATSRGSKGFVITLSAPSARHRSRSRLWVTAVSTRIGTSSSAASSL